MLRVSALVSASAWCSHRTFSHLTTCWNARAHTYLVGFSPRSSSRTTRSAIRLANFSTTTPTEFMQPRSLASGIPKRLRIIESRLYSHATTECLTSCCSLPPKPPTVTATCRGCPAPAYRGLHAVYDASYAALPLTSSSLKRTFRSPVAESPRWKACQAPQAMCSAMSHSFSAMWRIAEMCDTICSARALSANRGCELQYIVWMSGEPWSTDGLARHLAQSRRPRSALRSAAWHARHTALCASRVGGSSLTSERNRGLYSTNSVGLRHTMRATNSQNCSSSISSRLCSMRSARCAAVTAPDTRNERNERPRS